MSEGVLTYKSLEVNFTIISFGDYEEENDNELSRISIKNYDFSNEDKMERMILRKLIRHWVDSYNLNELMFEEDTAEIIREVFTST